MIVHGPGHELAHEGFVIGMDGEGQVVPGVDKLQGFVQKLGQDLLAPSGQGGTDGAFHGQAQQGDKILTVAGPQGLAFAGHGVEDLAQGRGHLGQLGLNLVFGLGHAGGVALFLGLGLEAFGFGHGLAHDFRGLGLGLAAHPFPEPGLDLFVMHGRTPGFELGDGGFGLALLAARPENDPTGQDAGIRGIR